MKFQISAVSLSLIASALLFPNKSAAVPSYSRQTGLACSSCHYAPPELNAFGRKFKLEGYTFATKPEVSEDKKDRNSGLHLLEAFPLSVVFDTSFTSTKAPQPGTQNGNFEFPQAVSLFLAGACIMAGLGTYFVLLMVVAGFLLWRGRLFHTRWALWPLLLSFPLPYIANTAGWMTAEIGRQPWVVYGLIRTSEGYSKYVSAGNGLFTLLGFMGMYTVLSMLCIVLVYRVIERGPEVPGPGTAPRGASLTAA